MKKNSNVEGIFNGLANLVEKIGDLAEKGEQFKRAMEDINQQKEVKVDYDVQVGLGGKAFRFRKREDQRPPVCEPITDLFDEGDHLLITVEMPGVSIDDIQLDLQGKQLTLRATSQHKQYYKKLLLPIACQREKMKLVCNNGILEIICPKT